MCLIRDHPKKTPLSLPVEKPDCKQAKSPTGFLSCLCKLACRFERLWQGMARFANLVDYETTNFSSSLVFVLPFQPNCSFLLACTMARKGRGSESLLSIVCLFLGERVSQHEPKNEKKKKELRTDLPTTECNTQKETGPEFPR